MRVPKYTVVSDLNLKDFNSKVEHNMEQGWMIQGGVSVVVDPNGNLRYFQAMTRYEIQSNEITQELAELCSIPSLFHL